MVHVTSGHMSKANCRQLFACRGGDMPAALYSSSAPLCSSASVDAIPAARPRGALAEGITSSWSQAAYSTMT